MHNLVGSVLREGDGLNVSIAAIRSAIENLQAEQETLRRQLIFFCVQLQTLQRQSTLCSETFQALSRGHKDIAAATLQVTQHLGT